jgi:hypothetical protein
MKKKSESQFLAFLANERGGNRCITNVTSVDRHISIPVSQHLHPVRLCTKDSSLAALIAAAGFEQAPRLCRVPQGEGDACRARVEPARVVVRVAVSVGQQLGYESVNVCPDGGVRVGGRLVIIRRVGGVRVAKVAGRRHVSK